MSSPAPSGSQGSGSERPRGRLWRAALGRELRKSKAGHQLMRSARRVAGSTAVKRTRAFDVEYYQAQLVDGPASRGGGLWRHFLDRGLPEGLAPHPLIEPTMLGPLRGAGADCVTRRLGLRTSVAPPHPLIDLAGWSRTHPESTGHPDGILGHFLASLTDDTLLPTDQRLGLGDLTYGEFRQHMLAVVTELTRQRRQMVGRLVGSFDETPHAPLLAGYRQSAEATGTSAHVSVVLAVRDRADQLGHAISSVVAQSWAHWELIIVDDGSVDDTVSVAQEFAGRDPRITVLRTPPQGVSAARNAGIAVAHGPFVAFLDSDNAWRPEFLRTMVGGLLSSGAEAAHAVVHVRHPDGDQFRTFDGDTEAMLMAPFVDLNVLVARLQVVQEIGTFDESLPRMVDFDLALRLVSRQRLLFVPAVAVDYDSSADRRDRISVRESPTWGGVVRSRYMIGLPTVRFASAQRAASGAASLLVDGGDQVVATTGTVMAALGSGSGQVVGISDAIVVADGVRPAAARQLQATVGLRSEVTVLMWPRPLGVALGFRMAAAHALAPWSLAVRAGVAVSPAALRRLQDAVGGGDAAAIVAPIVLDATGQVNDAGLTWIGQDPLPYRILRGHPLEDVNVVLPPGPRVVQALSGDAVLLDSSLLTGPEGLDPLVGDDLGMADLCLRMAARGLGSWLLTDVEAHVVRERVEAVTPEVIDGKLFGALEFGRRWRQARPRSDVSGWTDAGLTVAHVAPDAIPAAPPGNVHPAHGGRRAQPVVVRERRVVELGTAAGLPALRWSIKIGAPLGAAGDVWGDVSFAADLARSLRGLGQHVIVDRLGAHQKPTDYLDDVVLVLRGLSPVAMSPGRCHLLWVISHPDEVSIEEIQGYDAVFGAGEPWCTAMTAASGVLVTPLLQATDPVRFRPDAPVTASGEVLFVGSPRGVFRPVIRDALKGGLRPSVYGPGWSEFIPSEFISGPGISPEDLPGAYAHAGVVLNDHWDDMARWGFVSNRVFDAVSAGAVVVSDDVPGIEEMFPGVVRTYRDPEHLSMLIRDRTTEFGSEELRVATMRAVHHDHSFDVRARSLLDSATRWWGRAR